MKLERYASAQDAARAAAEAAQIIRRNEAQNVTERERHAHALAEVARLTSLEPVKSEAAESVSDVLTKMVEIKWGNGPDMSDPNGQPEQVAAE